MMPRTEAGLSFFRPFRSFYKLVVLAVGVAAVAWFLEAAIWKKKRQTGLGPV